MCSHTDALQARSDVLNERTDTIIRRQLRLDYDFGLVELALNAAMRSDNVREVLSCIAQLATLSVEQFDLDNELNVLNEEILAFVAEATGVSLGFDDVFMGLLGVLAGGSPVFGDAGGPESIAFDFVASAGFPVPDFVGTAVPA